MLRTDAVSTCSSLSGTARFAVGGSLPEGKEFQGEGLCRSNWIIEKKVSSSRYRSWNQLDQSRLFASGIERMCLWPQWRLRIYNQLQIFFLMSRVWNGCKSSWNIFTKSRLSDGGQFCKWRDSRNCIFWPEYRKDMPSMNIDRCPCLRSRSWFPWRSWPPPCSPDNIYVVANDDSLLRFSSKMLSACCGGSRKYIVGRAVQYILILLLTLEKFSFKSMNSSLFLQNASSHLRASYFSSLSRCTALQTKRFSIGYIIVAILAIALPMTDCFDKKISISM